MTEQTGKLISGDYPGAIELRLAVRAGDVEAIQRLRELGARSTAPD